MQRREKSQVAVSHRGNARSTRSAKCGSPRSGSSCGSTRNRAIACDRSATARSSSAKALPAVARQVHGRHPAFADLSAERIAILENPAELC